MDPDDTLGSFAEAFSEGYSLKNQFPGLGAKSSFASLDNSNDYIEGMKMVQDTHRPNAFKL